jgi:hypothetical protein
MDLSRRLILRGTLEITTQKPLGSVLPQIRSMNSSLKRAYVYAEEAGTALGERRRKKPAMKIESYGAFIAEFLISTLLLLGAIQLHRPGPYGLAQMAQRYCFL